MQYETLRHVSRGLYERQERGDLVQVSEAHCSKEADAAPSALPLVFLELLCRSGVCGGESLLCWACAVESVGWSGETVREGEEAVRAAEEAEVPQPPSPVSAPNVVPPEGADDEEQG